MNNPPGAFRTVTYKDTLYNYDTLMRTIETAQYALLATLNDETWPSVLAASTVLGDFKREIQALPVTWHDGTTV